MRDGLLAAGSGATYGDAIALRTFQAALEGDIAAMREVREAIERTAFSFVDEGGIDTKTIPTPEIEVLTYASAAVRFFPGSTSLAKLGVLPAVIGTETGKGPTSFRDATVCAKVEKRGGETGLDL